MAYQQWKSFNCYDVLEIPASTSPAGIRKAWIRASKLNHPDVGGSEEAQKRINIAYEILRDPVLRNSHDAYWLKTSGTSSYPHYGQEAADRRSPRSRTSYSHAPKSENQRRGRTSLGGLRSRVEREINLRREAIWSQLDTRTAQFENQFQAKFKERRQSAFATFLLLIGLLLFAGRLPILWIGVVFLAFSVLSSISGVTIAGRSFSLFQSGVFESIASHARAKAKESCRDDVSRLDRHYESLASISELLLRSSSFDDSEEQVARRLVASFFLMGYVPQSYDRDTRMLIFADGDLRIAVRFRHRTGRATNISYVRRLVRLMSIHRASIGFLFCTPGLSRNGAELAALKRIKWYSLETMNDWIESVLRSDYSGPERDLLANLDKLLSFIRSIARPIARRSRSYRYWR